MGAILNGLAVHRGFRVFGSTFLVFADYMRPAIRLAALMGLPGRLRFHARLDLRRRGRTDASADRAPGEPARDPSLTVIRPADAIETVEAWRVAMTHAAARVALVLSRQDLPVLDRARAAPDAPSRRAPTCSAMPPVAGPISFSWARVRGASSRRGAMRSVRRESPCAS